MLFYVFVDYHHQCHRHRNHSVGIVARGLWGQWCSYYRKKAEKVLSFEMSMGAWNGIPLVDVSRCLECRRPCRYFG